MIPLPTAAGGNALKERPDFPVVDRYLGIRLDVDLSALTPGPVTVVETQRRLRPEGSYGYIHALWWIWLPDGRSAASIPPGAASTVNRILAHVRSDRDLFDPGLIEKLKGLVNDSLLAAGLPEINRTFSDVRFACTASLLRRHHHGDCRRLTDESIPPAPGLKLPTHCFSDGVVYGIVADAVVACVAWAHRTGVMKDQVADLGVVTAPDYRKRGYAKTAVSAVVEHFTRTGGQALYASRPDNHASIATARSVGFVPYATSLILSTKASDSQP